MSRRVCAAASNLTQRSRTRKNFMKKAYSTLQQDWLAARTLARCWRGSQMHQAGSAPLHSIPLEGGLITPMWQVGNWGSERGSD